MADAISNISKDDNTTPHGYIVGMAYEYADELLKQEYL